MPKVIDTRFRIYTVNIDVKIDKPTEVIVAVNHVIKERLVIKRLAKTNTAVDKIPTHVDKNNNLHVQTHDGVITYNKNTRFRFREEITFEEDEDATADKT